MIIVQCIKDVEVELSVLKKELNRLKEKITDIDELKIKTLKFEIKKLNDLVEDYVNKLDQLEDISARIYYKIVYEGINVTSAITKIAEENYIKDIKPSSVSRLWEYYKKDVKNLISDENQNQMRRK